MNDEYLTGLHNGKYQEAQDIRSKIAMLKEPLYQKILKGNKLSDADESKFNTLNEIDKFINENMEDLNND